MNTTPKISIIVPVYKAEKYLNRCVDSILAQTFTDWELLLIDDGSLDQSGEMCDEYAAKDSRIIVFHKENGGVSSARNLGLDNARGVYVTFVDSDDWIDVNTLSICISEIEANDLDILQFSFSREEKSLGSFGEEYTNVCSLSDYLNKRQFLVCVGGNVIRSSVIQTYTIRFDSEMKLAEDQLFLFTCMGYAHKLKRIPNKLYFYYDNPQSATNNEKIEDIVYSSNKCIQFKNLHTLFAFRIDDLVLFFIEKLILKKHYSEAFILLENLNPTFYEFRPWPISLMIKISRHDMRLGFHIGCILYSWYAWIMNIGSQAKHKLLKCDRNYAKS